MPPRLTSIFLLFLRLGFTAFGGPAMVAYIREEVVEKRRWVEEGIFARGVAICNSIPGATAMQMAAYSGLRCRGPAGAAAAYLGFGIPAFLLMLLLTTLYERAGSVGPVVAAFQGLKLVVVAVVANAALKFGRSILKGWGDWLLAGASGLYILWLGSPVAAILASAAAGPILYRGQGDGPGGGEGTMAASAASNWPAVWLTGGGFAAVAGLLFLLRRPLFQLLVLMAKIDIFAFGGGYASLPLMLHEVVTVHHWMDQRTFMDGIALGQVTPGPIVITAAFVGHLRQGLAGAAAATLGVLTPSFLVLLSAVPYFDALHSSPLFRRGLRGILASFVGLLSAVAVRFALAVGWGPVKAVFSLAALAALYLGVDILWVVLVGAALALWLF